MSLQNHKCQIDCTNHDELINKLELKSKDLYYFWRNYQWLYNKYYNEPRQAETTQIREYSEKLRIEKERTQTYKTKMQQYENKFTELQRTVQHLQQQNKSFQAQNKYLENQLRNQQNQLRNAQNQNKSLTNEVHSLQSEIDRKKQSIPQLEADYQRQIKRLKDNIENYKNMEEKLTKNISQNEILINKLQRQLQSEKSANQSDRKRYEGQILRLEQSLDKLRLEIASQPHPASFSIDRSALMSQNEEITMSFTRIRQQAEQIINQQMQKTKLQLKQQLGNLIFTLSESELESLLIQIAQ